MICRGVRIRSRSPKGIPATNEISECNSQQAEEINYIYHELKLVTREVLHLLVHDAVPIRPPHDHGQPLPQNVGEVNQPHAVDVAQRDAGKRHVHLLAFDHGDDALVVILPRNVDPGQRGPPMPPKGLL